MPITDSRYHGLALGPNSDGQYIIGGTYATAGDMTSATAGQGITLTAAAPFALSVYGDDNGTSVASSWVSTGFFSYINFADQTAGSAFALTGQLHIGANITTADNFAGVYAIAESDGDHTVSAHVFGLQAGVSISSGTYAANYRMAAISCSLTTNGATTNGTTSFIQFMNVAAGGVDAMFSIGTVAGDTTGTGTDTGTTAGDQCAGHITVLHGANTRYINLYSDNS